MNPLIMLLIMLFLHVIADFNLQGILASMKQKKWWHEKVRYLDETMYRNDYKAALIIHGFSWAFVVMLPCMNGCVFESTPAIMTICYLVGLIFNASWHCWIDTRKANWKKLNLIEDQFMHVFQIFVTWLAWTIAFGW